MNLDETLNELTIKLSDMFKSEKTGHDIGHLLRVLENAKKIQATEGGDAYVVFVSALVHDMHRLMQSSLGHYVSPKNSLPMVKEILENCNVDKSKIDQILKVVEFHEQKYLNGLPLETQIVQDADALDALGEIGLNRTLKYCKQHNIPVCNKNIPLDCKEYVPDLNPISTCHYIYRTMIPQGKNMHTKTAKVMAKEQIVILEKFVDEHIKSQNDLNCNKKNN